MTAKMSKNNSWKTNPPTKGCSKHFLVGSKFEILLWSNQEIVFCLLSLHTFEDTTLWHSFHLFKHSHPASWRWDAWNKTIRTNLQGTTAQDSLETWQIRFLVPGMFARWDLGLPRCYECMEYVPKFTMNFPKSVIYIYNIDLSLSTAVFQ